jgi:hypothetical protein
LQHASCQSISLLDIKCDILITRLRISSVVLEIWCQCV